MTSAKGKDSLEKYRANAAVTSPWRTRFTRTLDSKCGWSASGLVRLADLKIPGADAADDARNVRHDRDVIAETRSAAGVATAHVEVVVPTEDRAQTLHNLEHPFAPRGQVRAVCGYRSTCRRWRPCRIGACDISR